MQTTVRELFRQSDPFRDQTVTISGWVRTIRDQKQFGFISLSDGTFFETLQVVFSRERLGEAYDAVARIKNGAAVTVTGQVVMTPEARQKLEIQADAVTLEGDSPSDYPLQPKRHSPQYLRSIAHLRPRTNLLSAVFRVRSVASFAIHRFFHERGFVYVHTPIITASDAEGAGEMFQVTTCDPGEPYDSDADFFGRKTHLTVSGQLNAEAFALAYKNVYTFGPTFRAENSNTPKHAAEFWMIEPEIAFADLGDDMKLAEAMIKDILGTVLRECPEEMAFFSRFVDKGLQDRLQGVLASEFAVMTYDQAIEALQGSGRSFEYPVEWGRDLQTEHERYLTETLQKKPVFVIDYPKGIKAFYMKQNDDGRTVAAMDLLVPGIGEIIGGSQREDDHDALLGRIRDMGLDEASYQWYLDLRRYGGVKHAGFGLGFERLIMYLTGVSNIRDVIPFPRTPGHAEF